MSQKICGCKSIVGETGQRRMTRLVGANRRAMVRLTDYSWSVEDWKNVAWSDESGFLLRNQMVGPEFGISSKNPWTQPALYQQSRLVLEVKWCDECVLSQFRPLNIDQS